MRTYYFFSAFILGMTLFSCNNKSEPDSSKSATSPTTGASTQAAAPAAAPASAQAAAAVENISRLDFPGTEDGAKALLESAQKKDANLTEMSKSLRPSAADYSAIFVDDVVGMAKTKYEEHWTNEDYVLEVKEGQTELLLWKATREQLLNGSGDVAEFPSGYKKVAEKLRPGLTFYRFKFVKPGDKHGMTYDGLVFVNGHWVMVSKPYRVIE